MDIIQKVCTVGLRLLLHVNTHFKKAITSLDIPQLLQYEYKYAFRPH